MRKNSVYNYLRNNYREYKDKNIVIHLQYKEYGMTKTSHYLLKCKDRSCYETLFIESNNMFSGINDNFLKYFIWCKTNIIQKLTMKTIYFGNNTTDEIIDLVCEA